MPSCPLVSIVIPTYNRASIIGEAVQSCREQTHQNCEIIIVDDGSTDDTFAVLSALERGSGGTVRVIGQSNAGASAARNAGLKAARGDYVQFLDSDDVLHPEKIEQQLLAMDGFEACDAALCFGLLEIDDRLHRIGLDLGTDPMSYVQELCSRAVHVMQTAAPLWRREFLTAGRLWNESISLGDDLEYHVRCMADARAVIFVSKELFTVRHHGGDRLSDFSMDNGRLLSLLSTSEAIFRTLTAKNKWTAACADNSTEVMRTLYINFLRRLSDDDVRHLETLIIEMARPSAKASALYAMLAFRRMVGRTPLSALVDRYLAPQHSQRPHVPALWRRVPSALKRRALRIGRMRPQDIAKSIQSFLEARRHPPETGTVLVVEPNEFHAETLPGHIALLSAAGYKCWVLARPRVDVAGALSRLQTDQKPKVLVMSLRAMATFLRSRAAGKFDLLFFNSGTIAERYGFFGGVLEYFRKFPKTRLGYLIMEHSDATLRSRRDWKRLNPERLFALTPLNQSDLKLKMLAPVEFGLVRQTILTDPLVFVTVGRVSSAQRNFAALVKAIEALKDNGSRPFKVIAVGSRSVDTQLPESIEGLIEFTGFLPFSEMYDVVERAHFFLPLLDTLVTDHHIYLSGNTSGSRQLCLGFEKIGIWERAFADAYGFTHDNAIIYEAGELSEGMLTAMSMSGAQHQTKSAAVLKFKQKIFQDSLSNLESFLVTQGDPRRERPV